MQASFGYGLEAAISRVERYFRVSSAGPGSTAHMRAGQLALTLHYDAQYDAPCYPAAAKFVAVASWRKFEALPSASHADIAIPIST